MLSTIKSLSICVCLLLHQTEIAKRLNTICAQVIPFLSQEVSMRDLELQTVLCIPFIHSNFTAKSAFTLRLWQTFVCLLCFTASAAGGSSCGASQAGDHGRAQCCHRGTWTARSSTYSVYSSTFSLLMLLYRRCICFPAH